MKKIFSLLAASGCLLVSSLANAAIYSFDVAAAANSSSGGTPLNTGLYFNAGDLLTIAADPADLWSAGALPRWSNADGLVGDLFATGSDESGQAAGTKIGATFPTWTQGGLTAPYGALIGQLASSYFLIGTDFTGPAADSGNLQLMYWDSNGSDNHDAIRVSVIDSAQIAAIPEPAIYQMSLLGLTVLGAAGLSRKLKRKKIN